MHLAGLCFCALSMLSSLSGMLLLFLSAWINLACPSRSCSGIILHQASCDPFHAPPLRAMQTSITVLIPSFGKHLQGSALCRVL